MFVSLLINVVNNVFTNSSWVMYERIIVIILNLGLVGLIVYLSNYHLRSNYLFEKIAFSLFFILLAVFYNLLSFSNDAAIPTIFAMLITVIFYCFPTYLFMVGINYLVKKKIN